MALIGLGESSDCASPILDAYFQKSGVLFDPALIEYIIYDATTPANELAPVQVFPGAGRATLDLNDCPVGQRLGPGHYVAPWTVPALEPLGKHYIRWFYKEVTGPPAGLDIEFVQAFVVGTGSAGDVVTFDVKDNQGVPVAVDGVQIKVYTAADVFIASGQTGQGADPAGILTLNLPGAPTPGQPYIVRLFKDGYTFDPGPTQTIDVLDAPVPPDSNIFDFVAIPPANTNSLDPDLCKVYGTFTDFSLVPAEGMMLEFRPVVSFPTQDPRFSSHFLGEPTIVRNNILAKKVIATTDENGFLCVELPRGGFYCVHIYSQEHPMFISEPIMIPNAPGWDIVDLLWLYVLSVTFGDAVLAVASGDVVETSLVVTASNGEQIMDAKVINDLVSFTVDDDAVATVAVKDHETLLITGAATGVVNVTATRKDDTSATRRPDIAALVVGPLVVTVS